MSSINVQFHALREELFHFIENWSKSFNFYIIQVKLFPETSAHLVPDFNEFKENDLRTQETDFIYLGLSPPDLSITKNHDFLDKNPNYLNIHLGKISDEGLRESSVGGITNDSEVLKIWKKITANVRKETSTGLWIINPVLMKKGFEKRARFTQGAYNLAKNGVKLLPAAGWNYYTIKEPDLNFQ